MKLLMTILVVLITQLSVAQTVDDFTLTDAISKNEVQLNDFANEKLVVIVFFSNDCAFTKHYVSRIKELNQLVSSNNSTLLLINSNSDRFAPTESVENMEKFIQENSISVPYLADKDQTVAKAFGARRTPEVFVLQFANGQAQIKYRGAIDDNAQSAGDVNHSFLNDAVRNLLSNKEVVTKSTRANGCLIK